MQKECKRISSKFGYCSCEILWKFQAKNRGLPRDILNGIHHVIHFVHHDSRRHDSIYVTTHFKPKKTGANGGPKWRQIWMSSKDYKKNVFYPNRKNFLQKSIRWNAELDKRNFFFDIMGTLNITVYFNSLFLHTCYICWLESKKISAHICLASVNTRYTVNTRV